MSHIDVERLLASARLAHLELPPAEAQRLVPQLERVLAAFERLQRLDLGGVEPLASPLELADVLRDDVPAPGLDGEELLRRAPDRDGPFFRLPRTPGVER